MPLTNEAFIDVFASLKQPGQPWAGNSYGERMTKTLFSHLPPEQQEEINVYFNKSVPVPVHSSYQHTPTDKFGKDPALRERFLTSFVKNPSRPHLAHEFHIPLNLVAVALHHATSKGSTIFEKRVASLANDHPEWAESLAQLRSEISPTTRLPVVYPNSWSPEPTAEEHELFFRLNARNKNELDEAGLMPSSITSGTATSPGGNTQYSQQVGQQHLGVGSRVGSFAKR